MGRLREFLVEARRTVRSRPRLLVLIALPVTLGTATAASVLTVARETVLADLPFPEPGSLLDVRAQDNKDPGVPWSISYPDFLDWQRGAQEAVALAVYSGPLPLNMERGEEGIAIRGEFVSSGYLPILGQTPMLGRFFSPAEDAPGGARVAVVSASLWRDRLTADPAVVGHVVRIGGLPFEVVGVGADGFGGLEENTDVWMPVSSAEGLWGTEFVSRRSLRWLDGLGRLEPGVTPESASGILNATARELESRYPVQNEDIGVMVRPLRGRFTEGLRSGVGALGLAAALLMFLVVANIAALMIVDAMERGRSMAVREALGAATSDQMRALLARAFALTVPGGVIGVVAGCVAAGPLMRLGRVSTPVAWSASSGVRAGVVLAGLVVLTGVAAAWLPMALRRRQSLADLTRQTSAGTTPGAMAMFRVLAGLQVALALVLTCSAVVLGRSFRDLARLDLGYAPDDVVSLRVAASGDEFRQTESFHTTVGKLRQSIADVPGVEAVAVMGPSLPTDMMNGARILSQEQWEKGGAAPTLIRIAYVSEQAFATLGIPILEGRDFDTRDMDADAQRVIGISKELADRLWPGQSALGRQIRLASGGNSWTVVNVVSSADLEGPLPSPSGRPLAYFPIYQTSSRWTPVINIIAHGRHGGTAALGERIRGIMKRELPGVEAYDAALIRDRIRQQTGPGRLLVLLVGAFAGIAAVIAVLGTYAAFAQLLGHHTREFGLRLALGSSPREIMFLAFRRGMTPGIIGAAAGCVGTLFLGSVMPAAATWVAPTRLADIALAAVLVLAGVVVAGLQARRAGRVDPVETLGAG